MRLHPLIFVAALLALMSSAHAEKMSFTLEELLNINAGISGLNGYEHVIKEGERERVIRKAFDLAPGTIMAIVKDARTIAPIITVFEETRNRLSGGEPIKESAKAQEIFEKLKPLLAKEYEVEMVKLKVSELKLEKNPIPISVLVAISPLVDDDGK